VPSVRAGVRRIRYKKETDKFVNFLFGTFKNESIRAKNIIFKLPAKQKYDSRNAGKEAVGSLRNLKNTLSREKILGVPIINPHLVLKSFSFPGNPPAP